MSQTVYVDVLFAVNLFINFLLLCFTAKVARLKPRRLRLLAGSALGALFALVIFFPEMNLPISLLAKLLFSSSILLVALPIGSFKVFIKTLACFFSVNFGFAGLMMVLWMLVAPPNLLINNGIVYFNISPLVLIAAALGCYIVLSLLHKLTRRKAPDNKIYTVTIEVGDERVTMDALLDTGHSLSEVISERPVLVAEYKQVEKLLPRQVRPVYASMSAGSLIEEQDESWQKRFRVIPFASVGGQGVLPAFRPDRITVKKQNQPVPSQEAFVAVSSQSLSGGEYHALLNPDMLQNT